jgi:hypothetical protein
MRTCWTLAILLVSATLALSGCAKRLPSVTPASGTVRLNGKPLPNAAVTFVPLLNDYGAETNSVAVTDEQGHFELKCRFKDQPGAVVGQHVVVVKETPVPENLRREQDGAVLARYRASLGNRPIPVSYTTTADSPLRIEVKPDQSVYDLDLQR